MMGMITIRKIIILTMKIMIKMKKITIMITMMETETKIMTKMDM